MTSLNNFQSRNYDAQDGTERHVFGEMEQTDTGTYLTLRGNGTQEQEAVMLHTGFSFAFPKNTNTEVIVFSSGSDTNLKFALPTIPRNKQRKYAEGVGGLQHPMDPTRAIEFNKKRTWLEDGTYAFGRGGEIELKDGKLYVRAELYVDTIHANTIIGPDPTPGHFDMPGFDK